MFFRIFFIFFLFTFNVTLKIEGTSSKPKNYSLTNEPIDVVIVTHPKDAETLGYCIEGIRSNCKHIGRIIVVSSEKLSDDAEWFDEALYPFTKEDIRMTIVRGSEEKAKKFFHPKFHRSPGWYFQQMLKMYAPSVIPGISSNVLVVDADTIFLNPTSFLNKKGGALFCYNNKDSPKPEYFKHAARLVPGYKRMYPQAYSVCHHILFQRAVLDDLFQTVEKYHKESFWKAFCHCVDINLANKGASEFETYFSFALSHCKQVEVRPLKWLNSSNFNLREKHHQQGYHFASYHDYLKKKSPVKKPVKKNH